MGSPIAPILADLVMEELLDSQIETLTPPLLCCKKCVDDLFLIVSKGTSEQIIEGFNSFYERLQFIIKEEQNGKLSFLDMLLIHKEDGGIDVDWYRKQCKTIILGFQTHRPLKHKSNMAPVLKKRSA